MAIDADDHLFTSLDPRPSLRVRLDELGLHVAALNSGDRTTHGLDGRHLRTRIRDETVDEPLDDTGPLEDVVVLQEVGLLREHLLDA